MVTQPQVLVAMKSQLILTNEYSFLYDVDYDLKLKHENKTLQNNHTTALKYMFSWDHTNKYKKSWNDKNLPSSMSNPSTVWWFVRLVG